MNQVISLFKKQPIKGIKIRDIKINRPHDSASDEEVHDFVVLVAGLSAIRCIDIQPELYQLARAYIDKYPWSKAT